jgi:hypothetical protein
MRGTANVVEKSNLGGQMAAGPITYQADGKQYVAIAAGHAMLRSDCASSRLAPGTHA